MSERTPSRRTVLKAAGATLAAATVPATAAADSDDSKSLVSVEIVLR